MLPCLIAIDDSRTDLALLERGLAALYQVAAAEQLGPALELCRRTPPAAVVIDLDLGPGSGDWSLTLAAVSSSTPAPVIVWTDAPEATRQPLRGLLLRAGADAVINKGADLAPLIAVLADARDRDARDVTLAHRRLAAVEASLQQLATQVARLAELLQDIASAQQQTPPAPPLAPGPEPGRLARLVQAIADYWTGLPAVTRRRIAAAGVAGLTGGAWAGTQAGWLRAALIAAFQWASVEEPMPVLPPAAVSAREEE